MTDRLHSFTLGDVSRENARTYPVATALVCGAHRLTYIDAEREVNALANLLYAHGVRPGHRVAWIGLSCHRLVELFYACSKLGAVAAPINWRLSEAEVADVLELVDPTVVLCSANPEFAQLATLVPHGVTLLAPDSDKFERDLADASTADVEHDDDDEAPVLLLMTAAFEGKPRGALLTSRGIVSQNVVLGAVNVVRTSGEVFCNSGPMFHIGMLMKTFGVAHWGGTNVIMPRPAPADICALINEERCTSAYLFEATIGAMIDVCDQQGLSLPTLHDAFGGVPAPAVAARWYELTSCRPPRGSGRVGYGATETTGMVTLEGRLPLGTGTFGRTAPLASMRILDPGGREVEPGEVGELVVRGPLVMAGYTGAASDEARWRNTGDLGRREPDGTITFIGPNREIIKSGMENIYPAEVENALRGHPTVHDVCVIGVPDPRWGSSVRAVVELVEGAKKPSADELIEFTRRTIASYKKPRSVLFVDALPRTNSFVDRDAVKAEFGE